MHQRPTSPPITMTGGQGLCSPSLCAPRQLSTRHSAKFQARGKDGTRATLAPSLLPSPFCLPRPSAHQPGHLPHPPVRPGLVFKSAMATALLSHRLTHSALKKQLQGASASDPENILLWVLPGALSPPRHSLLSNASSLIRLLLQDAREAQPQGVRGQSSREQAHQPLGVRAGEGERTTWKSGDSPKLQLHPGEGATRPAQVCEAIPSFPEADLVAVGGTETSGPRTLNQPAAWKDLSMV